MSKVVGKCKYYNNGRCQALTESKFIYETQQWIINCPDDSGYYEDDRKMCIKFDWEDDKDCTLIIEDAIFDKEWLTNGKEPE